MSTQVMLFGGYDSSGNAGLWLTNGTAAGTYELITGLFLPRVPGATAVFDGEVLFSGATTGHTGVWVTNGTAAGTYELTPITGPEVDDLTVLGNEVLFAAGDPTTTDGGRGLWVTNGTAAGTHQLTGIIGASTTYGLYPTQMTVFGGEVLFNGLDAAGNDGLWVTNGTAAGTHQLTGIVGALKLSFDPYDLTVFGGEVLFNVFGADQKHGLWVTNGTAAGTHELTGIVGANASGLDPYELTVFRGKVLFEGMDANGLSSLWVTDGTAAGTHELTGIVGANASTYGLAPGDLTVFGGEVLFNGLNASNHFGLWVTNGTAAGTHELTGIVGVNASGLDPRDLTMFNGMVYFDGTDAAGNQGLWVTNGTAVGTHELTIAGANLDVGLFPASLTPFTLTEPPPEVTGVAGSPSSGSVGVGSTVVITVDMSEAVIVRGSPTLMLNDGGVATYDSANSKPSSGDLVFDYTVAAGQTTSDLKVNNISLSQAATIENITGADANLSGARNADLGLQVGAPIPEAAISHGIDFRSESRTGSGSLDLSAVSAYDGFGKFSYNGGTQFVATYLGTTPNSGYLRAIPDDNAFATHSFSTVSIFERSPKLADYFTRAQADSDAADAITAAQLAGQLAGEPKNSAIYFTVDYDAPQKDLPAIERYFEEIRSDLKGSGYSLGVYGPGRVLADLQNDANVKPDYTWLTLYAWGREGFKGENIDQVYDSSKSNPLTIGVSTQPVDLDTANTAQFGQWINHLLV